MTHDDLMPSSQDQSSLRPRSQTSFPNLHSCHGKTPSAIGSIPPCRTCVSAVLHRGRYKRQRCDLCAINHAVPEANNLCEQRAAS
jgi:hypothetical protein